MGINHFGFKSKWLLLLTSITACSTGGSLRKEPEKPTAATKNEDRRSVEAPPVQKPQGPVVYRSAQDDGNTRSDYFEARRIFLDGKKVEGGRRIAQYVEQNPNGQYVDEAFLLLAQSALEAQKWSEAEDFSSKVMDMNPPSRLRGQAWIVKAKVFQANGRSDEALRSLYNVRLEELPQRDHLALFSLWGQLAEEQGNFRDAVLAFVKAYRQTDVGPEQSENIKQKINQLISNNLNEKEASLVVREYSNKGFPGNAASIRLAKLLMAKGNKADADFYINAILAYESHDSSYYRDALFLKQNVNSFSDSAESKIGVLFPSGGRFAAWSQRAREGIDLVWDKSPGLPMLVYEDSGTNLESFRSAFERLVLQEKVLLIIGPTLAEQAEQAAQLSQQYGVPYISLSPRSGLIEKSPYLFRFALSAELQAQAVVNYAWERLGAHRFAILFPEDNFGKGFAKPYFDAVKNRGGFMAAAESYNPNESDFVDAVRNLVGTAFPVFRNLELQDEVRLLQEKTGKPVSARDKAKMKLSPIVDFDVIFIPDTYKAVGQIIPTLVFEDLKDVKIFGPSSWNNKQLLSRAGQYMDNAYCVDISLAEKTDKFTQDFMNKYKAKFGRAPVDISAITYDLALSLKQLFEESKNLRSRDETRSSLESLGEIKGVVGKHRWDAERDPMGTLQLFQSRRGSFQYIGDISLLDFDASHQ
ncbi:MAG: penicillin-binding protein activator [Proteobacteria bacterium]|nr:penicillin-binding protein activator [Pseudomonadota bacterium]